MWSVVISACVPLAVVSRKKLLLFFFCFFVPGGGHAGGARLSCGSVSGGNSIIMLCEGAGELCREVDS